MTSYDLKWLVISQTKTSNNKLMTMLTKYSLCDKIYLYICGMNLNLWNSKVFWPFDRHIHSPYSISSWWKQVRHTFLYVYCQFWCKLETIIFLGNYLYLKSIILLQKWPFGHLIHTCTHYSIGSWWKQVGHTFLCIYCQFWCKLETLI